MLPVVLEGNVEGRIEPLFQGQMRRCIALILAAGLCFGFEARCAEPALLQTTVERSCVSCHDGDAPKGGLNLTSVVAKPVEDHPEVWEKVVRRLRGRQMPPAGKERPNEETYASVLSQLETALDRAAAAEAESRPHRHVPPAEPHRVSERHSRSAGAGHRRDGAAAGGRSEPRVRQRDGRRIFRRRCWTATSRPRRRSAGWRSAAPRRAPGGDTFRIRPDLTQEEHVDGLPLGHARRHADPLHVSARRRVRHPDPPRRATATSTSRACASRTSWRCCSTASA